MAEVKCRYTGGRIDPSHKSHNALGKYPTMHHFVTEMCTIVHISVTKWCIVGYGTVALWDLWYWSISWNSENNRQRKGIMQGDHLCVMCTCYHYQQSYHSFAYIHTSRQKQKGHCFASHIYKLIFLCENCFEIHITLKFIPKGPVDNKPPMVEAIARQLTGGTNSSYIQWITCLPYS